jgi:hypothetical protein
VVGLKREKIGNINIATINGARLGYGSGTIALDHGTLYGTLGKMSPKTIGKCLKRW